VTFSRLRCLAAAGRPFNSGLEWRLLAHQHGLHSLCRRQSRRTVDRLFGAGTSPMMFSSGRRSAIRGPARGTSPQLSDRLRRVSPVAPLPREGPLPEPKAGAQPWPREGVLMPHSGPPPPAPRSIELVQSRPSHSLRFVQLMTRTRHRLPRQTCDGLFYD